MTYPLRFIFCTLLCSLAVSTLGHETEDGSNPLPPLSQGETEIRTPLTVGSRPRPRPRQPQPRQERNVAGAEARRGPSPEFRDRVLRFPSLDLDGPVGEAEQRWIFERHIDRGVPVAPPARPNEPQGPQHDLRPDERVLRAFAANPGRLMALVALILLVQDVEMPPPAKRFRHK